MQKDTRANLIFLTAFLAISLPGAVILFKKKLDPAVPAMSLPPRPRTQIPYLSPMDAGDLRRYVPEQTGKFVDKLISMHDFKPVLQNGLPIMSSHCTVQLAGIKPGTTALLVWTDAAAHPENIKIQDVIITNYEDAILPPDLRKELIYAGYAQPPKQAAWIEITTPPLPTTLQINISGQIESLPLLARH